MHTVSFLLQSFEQKIQFYWRQIVPHVCFRICPKRETCHFRNTYCNYVTKLKGAQYANVELSKYFVSKVQSVLFISHLSSMNFLCLCSSAFGWVSYSKLETAWIPVLVLVVTLFWSRTYSRHLVISNQHQPIPQLIYLFTFCFVLFCFGLDENLYHFILSQCNVSVFPPTNWHLHYTTLLQIQMELLRLQMHGAYKTCRKMLWFGEICFPLYGPVTQSYIVDCFMGSKMYHTPALDSIFEGLTLVLVIALFQSVFDYYKSDDTYCICCVFQCNIISLVLNNNRWTLDSIIWQALVCRRVN